MSEIKKVYHQIGDVARHLNVSAATIHYWERYYNLRFSKSRNGNRMFLQKDIEILKTIKEESEKKILTSKGINYLIKGKLNYHVNGRSKKS